MIPRKPHQSVPGIRKRLYTVPEVAYYLGKSKDMIYQMVSKGTIPFVKLDRSTMFDVDELDGWIKERSHHGREVN